MKQLVAIVVIGFFVYLAKSSPASDQREYEKVKGQYCESDDLSWDTIDGMLDCYISAFHLISASEWDQVHGIVKFCENATFYNSSDAKEAFCSPQGFQTITQFNGCINDRLNGTGLNATVITPDKDFMLKVYKCLIVALDGNVSTEIPMTTTDDGTDEGSHSFSLSPKDEEPKETTQCLPGGLTTVTDQVDFGTSQSEADLTKITDPDSDTSTVVTDGVITQTDPVSLST